MDNSSGNPFLKVFAEPRTGGLLLKMLRPMEIVALGIATSFSLRPSKKDLYRYTRWWRQTFRKNILADQNRHIKVIGKDLNRLTSAIRRWDYFDPTAIKLLVFVRVEPDDLIHRGDSLIQSIDVSYICGTDQCYVPEQDVQVCVCVMSNPSLAYIDLYFLWARALLETIEAVQPLNMVDPFLYPNPDGKTFAPLEHIELPAGAMRSKDPIYAPGDTWFKTWHADLFSNYSVCQAVTRPEIQIDHGVAPSFPMGGILRLLVQTNGHLLIPHWTSDTRDQWRQQLAAPPVFLPIILNTRLRAETTLSGD